LETLHLVIENWDFTTHSKNHQHEEGSQFVNTPEDQQRKAETSLYLSIFAQLRLISLVVQLINQNHIDEVVEYLSKNWIEMVGPESFDDKENE